MSGVRFWKEASTEMTEKGSGNEAEVVEKSSESKEPSGENGDPRNMGKK